ncbi:hypothetical protein OHB54_45035 [Streptomyces sp. NBC_01007]|nr:hypothetical protein OHB54_45035 [Streptomyces sp. NBC_01007]
MPARFGPFEFTDGEWVIGDPAGDHVRLRRDGLSHWVQGGEIRQMAWSRVMDIVLSVQPVRRDHSKRLRKVAVMLSWLGQPTEHVGLPASLGIRARHPYEEWGVDFTHHAHRYPRREITAACKLLNEVATSGRAAQLGDPEWLSAVVQELSGHRQGSRSLVPRKRAIRAALDA